MKKDNIKVLVEADFPANVELQKNEQGSFEIKVKLPHDLNDLVRENLIQFVKGTKMNIVKIAEELNVTPPTLYKFRNGENSMTLDRVDELNKLMQEHGYFIYL